MRLRDDYTADCQRGLDRWNKVIAKVGVPYKFELPHVGFHRQIGEFKDVHATPAGELIDDAAWEQRRGDWLPSQQDGDFIAALMKSANWGTYTVVRSLTALSCIARSFFATPVV